MHSKSLPLPNASPTKRNPFVHRLTTIAHVAFRNLQRHTLYRWQSRTTSLAVPTPKPSLTRGSSAVSNLVFVLLCALWYTTSALSSNTGKAILNQFRYPITLTFIQFGFVGLYCLLFMSPLVRFSRLRRPTKTIVQNTLPMGMFQVGGHMFSSIAISRIPVSTVHTIKALSPLFTVAAYALLFGVSYSSKTYISLLPLTIGVMLACSFDVASDFVGLLCAFGSALVFVSSNIFFKKIMPSSSSGPSAGSHKLDKLNLLLYSSGMAFLLMVPIWMYYDLPALLSAHAHPEHIVHPRQGHAAPHSVTYYFFMNGTVHFAQNIIAFVILASTSPVTYSIASLIKRVAVICIAIIWFNQSVHPVQAFGIVMTFLGLYMYNNAKGDVEKGEKKAERVTKAREMVLPTNIGEQGVSSLPLNENHQGVELGFGKEVVIATGPPVGTTAYARPRTGSVISPKYAHPHQHQHQHRPRSTSTDTHPKSAIPSTIPEHGYPLSQAIDTQPSLSLSSAATAALTKQRRRSPSLSLRITPVVSYPSPPPSLDSPSSHTIPLPQGFLAAPEHGYGMPEKMQHVNPIMA